MAPEESVKWAHERAREDLRLIRRRGAGRKGKHDGDDRRRRQRRRAYAALPRRGPITRALEDERWLAAVLLLPTIVLLGLFIAYPFVKGVLLAVTDTKVGIEGNFVGLDNFEKLWNDSIFHVAVYNTFLYTFVTTVFKLALGLWLALLVEPAFPGQGVRARLHPAAVYHPDGSFDLRLEVDVRSHLQRPELDAVPSRADTRSHQLARRPRSGDDLGDNRQYLARRAVLRDHAARRVADDQSRIARGRGNRRRPGMEPVPPRDLAAAVAGNDGRRAVLGDPDLRRFPACLCA